MVVETERFLFDGPAGALEAMLELPESLPATPAAVAVVCHPHPQFQGTMLNKVVHTLARSALDNGWPALRFNYRGVGKSEGNYDEGRGETDDALAACELMTARFNAPLVLMGFSFGAGVSLRLASRNYPSNAISAVLSAAPPVGRLGVPDDLAITVPWLVIQGSADELVDAQLVKRWAEQQSPTPELVMLDGVSHFFHGSLTVLRQHAVDFLHRADFSAR
ncbi:MAG: alpha/beta fold hydrolase [Pseudomonadota bacterium]